jgi:hypothetical protein
MHKRKRVIFVFLLTVVLISLTTFFSSRATSFEEEEASTGQGKFYIVGMGPALR